MADHSAIQWTDATWNPVTGCDRVSPGCANCYALTLAKRLKAMGNPRYQRDGKPYTSGPGFGVTLHHDLLDLPLRWKRPRRIFVNSMSDLFHEEIPFEFIDQVFATMLNAPQHTFQVLTKRPRRMLEFFRWSGLKGSDQYLRVGGHIWLGTSVETQYWADRRIPYLLEIPGTVRFLSCEPLLGPIALDLLTLRVHKPSGELYNRAEYINWVIVGGESGPKHRLMDRAWARSLRQQCVEAGVAFFFKQHGGANPKAGGRILDGRTWDEFPLSPQIAAAGGTAYGVSSPNDVVDRAKQAASAGQGNDAGAVLTNQGEEL